MQTHGSLFSPQFHKPQKHFLQAITQNPRCPPTPSFPSPPIRSVPRSVGSILLSAVPPHPGVGQVLITSHLEYHSGLLFSWQLFLSSSQGLNSSTEVMALTPSHMSSKFSTAAESSAITCWDPNRRWYLSHHGEPARE